MLSTGVPTARTGPQGDGPAGPVGAEHTQIGGFPLVVIGLIILIAAAAGVLGNAGSEHPFPELSANISLTMGPRLRVSRAAGNPAVPLPRTDAEGIRPPPS